MIRRTVLWAGLLCATLWVAPGIYGQPQSGNHITFSNWQKKDGLPSNNILAVAKDNKGFLWIATDAGLCRYDGPGSIQLYQQAGTDPGLLNSLQSDNIRSLLCDSEGYLWIGTRYGGLTRFHPGRQEWKTYRHDPTDVNSLGDDEILTLMEDSQRRLWIGTDDGLCLYHRSTETFTHFTFDEAEGDQSPPKPFLTVFEDDKGWIWAGAWASGFYLLLPDAEGNFDPAHYRHFLIQPNMASNNVWSFFQDRGGRYWVGTHGGGLLLMDIPSTAHNKRQAQDWVPSFLSYAADSPEAPNLHSRDIQTIIQDQFDNLWVGTTYGLYMLAAKDLPPLHTQDQPVLHFNAQTPDHKNAASLVGDNVMHLFEDDQGLIWASTTSGLSQYNWYSNQFNSFDLPRSTSDIQDAPNVFMDKRGLIWIGNWEGGLQTYRFTKEGVVPVQTDLRDKIDGLHVSSIHSPDGEWLYVGTERGITALHMESLENRRYPLPPALKPKIQDLVFKSILVDRDGVIWFGTNVGLFKITPHTKAYHMYEPELGNPYSISDNSVTHIIQDKTGAIWVATYKGLNRIQEPGAVALHFERFQYNIEAPEEGPINDLITYLKEDDSYLYVGTISGLCRFNFARQTFEALNEGMHKYWIRSIETDRNGNYWASTNEGIVCFNPAQHTFRTYDKHDGLRNTAFLRGCGFLHPDGSLVFAYSNGLLRFSPIQLATNTAPPPVFITKIEKISPQGSAVEMHAHDHQIDLAYDDYRLIVHFAALNYIRGDKNAYKYRLAGFEDQWNHIKFGTPIVYTNLSPKSYRLEIIAANNDGVWNEVGSGIEIMQYPPFWETLWFRLASFFILSGLILLMVLRYTNTIRKRNEELQTYNTLLSQEISQRKYTELELQRNNRELKRSNLDLEQFAYIASHDLKEPVRVVGSYAGLLAMRYQSLLDKEGIEYLGYISTSAHRLAKLIESLLTFSTAGRKTHDFSRTDLNTSIRDVLVDISANEALRYAEIEVGSLPTIMAQKEQIKLVFFHLIHNAVKFNQSDTPQIVVQAEESDETHWKFSVSDNGIGIDPRYHDAIFDIFKRLHLKEEYEGTGIGLSVCRKIVVRHQGRIWFDSVPGLGSTFFFTVRKSLGRGNWSDQAANQHYEI